VKVSVEAVKGAVSLPGPALQILPPMSKARSEGVRKSTYAKGCERKNCEI
jgi:hypothetical protein